MAINRLLDRKKTYHSDNAQETIEVMTNHELRTSIIGFNYDELNIADSDKTLLISFEKELAFQGKQLGNIAYIIGENLNKAKSIFKKYGNRVAEDKDPDTFLSWYTGLGLSKDQVSLFLGRFNLAIAYPDYKERVISLSDRAIKETINKKTPKELAEKVLLGELTTSKEIKNARASLVQNQISSMLEISGLSTIESESDKLKRIKKEIRLLREEAVELRQRAKELDDKANELEKTIENN